MHQGMSVAQGLSVTPGLVISVLNRGSVAKNLQSILEEFKYFWVRRPQN